MQICYHRALGERVDSESIEHDVAIADTQSDICSRESECTESPASPHVRHGAGEVRVTLFPADEDAALSRTPPHHRGHFSPSSASRVHLKQSLRHDMSHNQSLSSIELDPPPSASMGLLARAESDSAILMDQNGPVHVPSLAPLLDEPSIAVEGLSASHDVADLSPEESLPSGLVDYFLLIGS